MQTLNMTDLDSDEYNWMCGSHYYTEYPPSWMSAYPRFPLDRKCPENKLQPNTCRPTTNWQRNRFVLRNGPALTTKTVPRALPIHRHGRSMCVMGP